MFTKLCRTRKSCSSYGKSRPNRKHKRNLRLESLSQRKLFAADFLDMPETILDQPTAAEHDDYGEFCDTFSKTTIQPNYYPSNPNGNIIHVDDSNTGSQNGMSWLTAFSELQDGLAVATSGDWIFVAAGTYSPGTTQTDSFWLKSEVDLFGGYEGAFQGTPASEWYTRDWNGEDKSILSGDITGNDVYPATINGAEGPVADIQILNNGDNNYHVLRASRVSDTVLKGFFVEGGHDEVSGGGGLWNRDSTIEISDSVFRFNQGNYGGAIHNIESNPFLHEVVFDRNIANEGGGAMANLNATASPQITINSVFYKNRADGASQGGAIYDVGDSITLVWNSTLQGNDANTGDSIYSNQSTLFVGNSILGLNDGGTGSGIADAGNVATVAMHNNLPTGWTSAANNQFIQNNLNEDTGLLLNATDAAAGPDGDWATVDDGLQINANVQGNPFIGHTALIGSTQLAPERDILNNLRLPVADIGSYQHFPMTNTKPGPVGGPVGPIQYLRVSSAESNRTELDQQTRTVDLYDQAWTDAENSKVKSQPAASIEADDHASESDSASVDSTVDSTVESERDQVYANWESLDHSNFLQDLEMLIHELAVDSLDTGSLHKGSDVR